jgi:hypothetical protein
MGRPPHPQAAPAGRPAATRAGNDLRRPPLRPAFKRRAGRRAGAGRSSTGEGQYFALPPSPPLRPAPAPLRSGRGADGPAAILPARAGWAPGGVRGCEGRGSPGWGARLAGRAAFAVAGRAAAATDGCDIPVKRFWPLVKRRCRGWLRRAAAGRPGRRDQEGLGLTTFDH